MHGDEFVRLLHRAHGCREDCWECRAERDDWIIQPYTRWNKFTESESVLRIGYAVVETGARFPKFSDDEMEQWLIEESVLKSYHDTKLRVAKEQSDREEAERRAKEGLETFKAQRGF